MPTNECIPYLEPGTRPTGHATAAITGKRFLAISATIPGGPAGSENIRVAMAGAGVKSVGVSAYDAVINEQVPLVSGPGIFAPVTAGAAITAGQEVQSDATGQAVPLAAGKSNGIACSDAAIGVDTMVRLYT